MCIREGEKESTMLSFCNQHVMRVQFNVLQRAATHCSTLRYTAENYSTLQHTAAQCSKLQHTVTHCNTLQHTATYCNTLQHTHDAEVERLVASGRINKCSLARYSGAL